MHGGGMIAAFCAIIRTVDGGLAKRRPGVDKNWNAKNPTVYVGF